MSQADNLKTLRALAAGAKTVHGPERVQVLDRLQALAQEISDESLIRSAQQTSHGRVAEKLGISRQAVSLRVKHAKLRRDRRYAARLEGERQEAKP
jgi:hypothetical protein